MSTKTNITVFRFTYQSRGKDKNIKSLRERKNDRFKFYAGRKPTEPTNS
jgi:hypothetical protein